MAKLRRLTAYFGNFVYFCFAVYSARKLRGHIFVC